MSEETAIAATKTPLTEDILAASLRALGLQPGDTVFMNSSLSRLGYVSGGAPAVVRALFEVLGKRGTLCVPSFSGDLSDPAHWVAPPVPDAWWPILRQTMSPYDPALTRPRRMGAIADTVRCLTGAIRSAHPQCSFAAYGPLAEEITTGHGLENEFGETSPLGRLYALNARVLLLGVGFANNTCFHLGEHRSGVAELTENGAPIMEDGRRVWKTFRTPDYDSDDFEVCGAAFEETGAVAVQKIGLGTARLFSLRAAVDFAERWLPAHRSQSV